MVVRTIIFLLCVASTLSVRGVVLYDFEDGMRSNLTVALPLWISGDNAFSVSTQPGATQISPGSNTTFSVQFTPTITGSHSGRITLTNSSTQKTYVLDFFGTGIVLASSTTNVVAWDFQDTNQIADAGISFNLGSIIARETNYTKTYTYPGAGSYALSSSSWQNGTGTNCWLIDFNASSWGLLTLSSKQKSSDGGPRDFRIQYRIDKEAEWTDVPGGSITVTNDSGTAWKGTVTNLPLPFLCDNHASVYVRWVVAGTNAVNGGIVASSGTSRIDDIMISGVPVPEPGVGVLFVIGYSLFVGCRRTCRTCRTCRT